MSTVARSVRPQVGLMLSCGEAPTAGRNHPRKLDYIRAKRGSMGQFGEYAEKFEAIYGTEPRDVDVIFVEDAIGSVLDVRPKVWGASRLKAVGNDNLADSTRRHSRTRCRPTTGTSRPSPMTRQSPGRTRSTVATTRP